MHGQTKIKLIKWRFSTESQMVSKLHLTTYVQFPSTVTSHLKRTQ